MTNQTQKPTVPAMVDDQQFYWSKFCEEFKLLLEKYSTSRILLVTVTHMLYPITTETLSQAFSPHGSVEKIVPLQQTINFQALIKYHDRLDAISARNSFHGRYIYDGCCQMDIQFYKDTGISEYDEPKLESQVTVPNEDKVFDRLPTKTDKESDTFYDLTSALLEDDLIKGSSATQQCDELLVPTGEIIDGEKIKDGMKDMEAELQVQVKEGSFAAVTVFAKVTCSSIMPKTMSGLVQTSFVEDHKIAFQHKEQEDAAVPQSQFFSLKDPKLLSSERSMVGMPLIRNAVQASTIAAQETALEWVKKDNRRMLHVVYRVGDLDRTIKFYTECFGMKLLRKRDIPEERYINAFLGYGPEDSHFVIELTYNYGLDRYDIGTAFGHFGIAVEDVAKTVELIKVKGGKVTREPGPVKGGTTVIAFVEDPDGYKFELIERWPAPEPLCQVMLRVGDFDRSIKFYEKAFGMELLRTRDNPEYKYTIAMMGYGPEDTHTVLELTYNYGVTDYEKGNGYAQIAMGTDDVYKTAEAVKLFGGKVTREPGPLPGINTKILSCLDPDGWKTVFVDNIDFLKEFE